MAWSEVPLVGFAPDMPYDTPGVIISGKNVLPTTRGIGAGVYTVLMGAGAIDADSVAAATVTKADGTERMFIGTSAKIWEYNGTTTNTDRSGGAYNASSTQPWTFCSVGDIVFAANKGDFLQQINAGASFAAVGAAPVPKCAIIMNVGPPSSYQLMALNYNDGTNNYVDGWFCSALGNYADWTTSLATQCANGRLLEPSGPFTAGIGFRDGCLAFKANAMFRGTYIGDTVNGIIWQWERIASNVGCLGPGYVCIVDDVAYFADRRGIWMFDGSYPRKLPGAVHQWWANTATSGTTPTLGQMRYDPVSCNLHIMYAISGTARWFSFNTISQLWSPPSAIDTGGTKYLKHIIKTPTPGVTGFATVGSLTSNPVVSTAISSTSTYPDNMFFEVGLFGGNNNFVFVDRLQPIWVGVNKPPTTTTFQVSTTTGQAGSRATGATYTIDSTQRWFDFTASNNFIGGFVIVLSSFEFTKIGISADFAGSAGKR